MKLFHIRDNYDLLGSTYTGLTVTAFMAGQARKGTKIKDEWQCRIEFLAPSRHDGHRFWQRLV